jgi:hypothetical protein
MTTEQKQPSAVVWAAPADVTSTPAPPAKPRSIPKLIAVIVAAVVVAIGGGVAVSHLSSSTTTSQNGAGAGGPGGAAGMGGGQGGPGGGMGGGAAGALHGDYVVSSNGTYVTRRTQTGEVTAVSSSSISVTSADGYASTYAITSSTTVDNGDGAIGDIKTGATISVVGTVTGTTATAVSLSTQTANAGNQPPANQTN